MSKRATFPYTEIEQNDEAGVPNSSVTSTSVKSYKPSSLTYAEPKPKADHNSSVIDIVDRVDEVIKLSQNSVTGETFLSALKSKTLRVQHHVNAMVPVKPAISERNLEQLSPSIPAESPIFPLQNLQAGWDGYWATPLSQHALLRAHYLWLRIKQLTSIEGELPSVSPAANGSIAFTWSGQYPAKELEIWLYDQPDYHAEWMLSNKEGDEEGTSETQTELLNIVRQYQES